MKKFFTTLLKDERGAGSTKRVISLIGMLFLCVTMLLNSFSSEDIKPAHELVTAIEMIIIVSIGASTVDKFSAKTTAANADEEA